MVQPRLTLNFLFIITFAHIQSRIIFERYESEENLDILHSNITFSSDYSSVTVATQVYRQYDVKILLKINFYQQLTFTGKQQLMLSFPKVNYCDITKKIREFPMISQMMAAVGKKKNNSMSCPVPVGGYLIEAFEVDDKRYGFLAILVDNRRYSISITMTDENQKPVIFMFRYKFHLIKLPN